jgi:hypothetical protein
MIPAGYAPAPVSGATQGHVDVPDKPGMEGAVPSLPKPCT